MFNVRTNISILLPLFVETATVRVRENVNSQKNADKRNKTSNKLCYVTF